jgi:hypothetical protein
MSTPLCTSIAMMLLCAATSLPACHHAPQSLYLPLTWRPTDDLNDMPKSALDVFTGQRVRIATFTDGRPVKDNVGANMEEKSPRPVLTQDSVGQFVSMQTANILRKNGVTIDSMDATRTIQGEVVQFFVTEENTYQADVVVKVTVENALGNLMWQGVIKGHARRFGHSFLPENYHEALSNAVLGAVTDLLENKEFQQAMRGHASAAPSEPPAEPSERNSEL